MGEEQRKSRWKVFKPVSKISFVAFSLFGISILVGIVFVSIIVGRYDIGIGGEYSAEITSSVGTFIGGISGSLLTLASILLVYDRSSRSMTEQKKQTDILAKDSQIKNVQVILENLERLHMFYGLFSHHVLSLYRLGKKVDEVEDNPHKTAELEKDSSELRFRLSSSEIQIQEDYRKYVKRVSTDVDTIIDQTRILNDLYTSGTTHEMVLVYLSMVSMVLTAVKYNYFPKDTEALIGKYVPHVLKVKIYKEFIKNLNKDVNDIRNPDIEKILGDIGEEKVYSYFTDDA